MTQLPNGLYSTTFNYPSGTDLLKFPIDWVNSTDSSRLNATAIATLYNSSSAHENHDEDDHPHDPEFGIGGHTVLGVRKLDLD